jgi:hypothetical protein
VATALRGHEARIESFYQSRTTYDHRPPAKPLSITFANLILYFVPSNVRQHPKTRGAISTIGQEPSRSNRVLRAPLCRASHPLLSSWYIPANQNVTKGLFTLARMTGIVKSHRVYSTKLSASCRMAMETKSIASVGQARFDSLVGLYSREAILGKLGELVGLAAQNCHFNSPEHTANRYGNTVRQRGVPHRLARDQSIVFLGCGREITKPN